MAKQWGLKIPAMHSLATWLVILLSTALLQWHSIQFWVSATGNIGCLWSPSLECSALWLWWQRKTGLACCASLLVIAAPLLQMVMPQITQQQHLTQQITQHENLVAIQRNHIAQLTQSLAVYQRNSIERLGWAERIDDTQQAINHAQSQLANLQRERPVNQDMSSVIGVALLKSAALLVILLSQIIAINKLRNVVQLSNTQAATNQNTCATPSTTDSNASDDATALAQHLAAHLQRHNLSQAEWGRRHNIPAKAISLIKHHHERLAQQRETIGQDMLERIKTALQQDDNST